MSAEKRAVPKESIRTLTKRSVLVAARELSAADPKLGAVIERVGPCTMLPSPEGSHFDAISRSIVYQQLTGKAAATIHGRFVERIGTAGLRPTPEQVLQHDIEVFRECGLSSAKTAALRDLAAHVVDGRLPVDSFDSMPDNDIVDMLVKVRGIGPWTAQMFLMFRLGRADVLPLLDLGVKKGAQRIHGMRKIPDEKKLEKLARSWKPWRSVASWYCWRALELE